MEQTPATEQTYQNRKQKYYHTHKNDPDFQERIRINKANYYQNHRDEIKAKCLKRYHDKKAANAPPTVAEQLNNTES